MNLFVHLRTWSSTLFYNKFNGLDIHTECTDIPTIVYL